MCTLRHVTARHDFENEAREAVRKSYGIGNIIKLLRDKNFKEHWGIIKASVGLIKNLALSPSIIPQLCEQNAVRRLIELLVNVDRERTKLYEENRHQYLHQFDVMIELIVGALNNFAKDLSCKTIIKETNVVAIFVRVSGRQVLPNRIFLSSIVFFFQYSHLPSCSLQHISSNLLKELNIDRDRVQSSDSSSYQQSYNNTLIDSRHNRQ